MWRASGNGKIANSVGTEMRKVVDAVVFTFHISDRVLAPAPLAESRLSAAGGCCSGWPASRAPGAKYYDTFIECNRG